MRELHLFAGCGGGILGGMLLGHTCVCAVEIVPYRRKVLLQRQRDGLLSRFPIWDDVTTFDGRPWRGRVDVVAGGFPCQDISTAGKGEGIDGARSGLWVEMARIIREVRPQYAFVENSPMLTSRGLGRVLGDLAEMGMDAKWGVVSAADAIFLNGTPSLYHGRERIWIFASSADADSLRELQPEGPVENIRRRTGYVRQENPDTNSSDELRRCRTLQMGRKRSQAETSRNILKQGNQWAAEPSVGRMAYGVANRVDRLNAIGDGQVPAVAALAWRILSE